MRTGTKNIFSSSTLPVVEKSEAKKTSYWLEKLFNQAKDKEKRELIKEDQTPVPVAIQTSSGGGEGDNGIQQLSSEEIGQEEAVISLAGKVEKSRQAVEDMVSSSNRILLKVSSVFPFDVFQSSIIVEETRLTIIHRQLFSSQVHSVDIKNISNIFLETGILFAQLTVVSDTFAENQIVINKLWKKDAIFVRRIIEGMRMFISKNIDTTGYEVRELISKLKELSTTGIVL